MIIQIALGILLAPLIGWGLLLGVLTLLYGGTIAAIMVSKIFKTLVKTMWIPILLYMVYLCFQNSPRHEEIAVVLFSVAATCIGIKTLLKVVASKPASSAGH